MKSILECVPEDLKLRDIQVAYGKWIEENFHNYDVFVVPADVGSGKSWMAMMTAKWLSENGIGRTSLVVPNKMLQDQYTGDFPYTPVLKGMSNYQCRNHGGTCKDTKVALDELCSGGCSYKEAKEIATAADTAILNLHIYSGAKMYKGVFVADEAHNIEKTTYSMYGVTIWKCEEDYGDISCDSEQVKEFLTKRIAIMEEDQKEAVSNLNSKLAEKLEARILTFEALVDMIQTEPQNNVIIKKKEEFYRGSNQEARNTMQEYLFIKPINIKKLAKKLFWPDGLINKIFLLSATFNEEDIKLLGLDEKRVCYFKHPSPIPPDRRPFIVWPVANMSYKTRKEGLTNMIKGILKVAETNPEKGLIHCTYETAEKLRQSIGFDARYLFHTNKNKEEIYNYFRNSKGNHILVASGMAEGIDLPNDAARWQIITQVMYPSLQDDVNIWRANNAPDLYLWDTVKMIRQQTGRVCRGATDYGKTYILDSQFGYLWKRSHFDRIAAGKECMWGKSFEESMIWPKKSQ